MKGKTVMFVGDSLGRNQWESLVCLLHAAAPQSPSQLVSADPLYTYRFMVRVQSMHVHALDTMDMFILLVGEIGNCSGLTSNY